MFTTQYSGITAKAKAMYGKRLRLEDYEAMKNLPSVTAIAAYLKQHPGYEDVMENISADTIHRGALEAQLHMELSREYVRLLRFATNRQKTFLGYQAAEQAMEEILYYLRLIISGRQKDYLPRMMPEVAAYCHVNFMHMPPNLTFAQFVDHCQGSIYYTGLASFVDKQPLNYTDVELNLRGTFYRYMQRLIHTCLDKHDARILSDFIGGQIDLLNFSRIIRCKKFFHQPDDHIYTNLFPYNRRISAAMIQKMVTAPDWEAAYALIEQTPYAGFFHSYQEEYVEEYVYRYIFNEAQRILFTQPSGICVPFAYLQVKQVEIRNLIHLIECVRYGIPPENIDRHLITQKGGDQ